MWHRGRGARHGKKDHRLSIPRHPSPFPPAAPSLHHLLLHPIPHSNLHRKKVSGAHLSLHLPSCLHRSFLWGSNQDEIHRNILLLQHLVPKQPAKVYCLRIIFHRENVLSLIIWIIGKFGVILFKHINNQNHYYWWKWSEILFIIIQ